MAWFRADTYRLGSKSSYSGAEKLFRLDALNEAHISANVGSEFQSCHGLLHAKDLSGVCASDDNKVRSSWDGIAGYDGSTDAGEELFARHNLLAHQVAAALGLDLIFNMASGNPGPGVL
jgi:hypothetical protein